MGRPALRGVLPVLVSALAGCATAATVTATAPVAADLPPPARGDGTTVAGDEAAAVRALVASWREALEARDVAALRSLVAPRVGGFTRVGPGMSREAWLAESDAIFSAAARARAALGSSWVMSFAQCAPSCVSPLLAPGQFIVAWPGVPVEGAAPNVASNQVLPSRLRVAVGDGVARVVGVDDEIASARGPALPRLSGAPRP